MTHTAPTRPARRASDTAESGEDIEITPEMIAAGVEVLSGFNRKFELEADGVARIFQAMELARRGERLSQAVDTSRSILECETVLH